MKSCVKRAYRALLVFMPLLLVTATAPDLLQAADRNLRNSLGMEFVLIPAGSFMMGSPAAEKNHEADETVHEVILSRPFYLQTTEVTEEQWRAVMGSSWLQRGKGGSLPVVQVSWFDCEGFMKKLNSLGEGTYRLPTEAEWEYACRAGSQTAYAWGDNLTCDQALFSNNSLKSADCADEVKRRGLPLDGPAPVGSYTPNAWGLFDMHGNVWEWCQDWYGPYPTGKVIDPTGPPDGLMKVRRGGSWFKEAWLCRSANRNFAHPASRYRTLGFRVLREAE